MNRFSKRTWFRKCVCALMVALMLTASVYAEPLPVDDPDLSEQLVTQQLFAEDAAQTPDEGTAIGEKSSYGLFFLVSDYGRDGHILNDATLQTEYALTLMSVASALREKGQLDALGIAATQQLAAVRNVESFMIEDLSDAPAALYHFMHTTPPSLDGMSGNTGIDIRAFLDYCKERELRPFIMIVYGNDLRQFNETLKVSDPFSGNGILLYLHGGNPIRNIERLDEEWDGELLELSAEQLSIMLTAPFEDVSHEWETWIRQEENSLTALKNDVAHELMLIVRADSVPSAVNAEEEYSVHTLSRGTYLLSMTPNSTLTLNQNVTVEQVYCRESKAATQHFNAYCESLNDILSTLTTAPFSLDLPADAVCTLSEVQMFCGDELLPEAVTVGQSADGQWLSVKSQPSAADSCRLELTVEMNGLRRTLSTASLTLNHAPVLQEAYALTGEYPVGAFTILPEQTQPYARIDLNALFHDAEGDLLTFLLDGVPTSETYIELMPPAEGNASERHEMTVHALDALGNQSAPLKLTWEFLALIPTEEITAPPTEAVTPEATAPATQALTPETTVPITATAPVLPTQQLTEVPTQPTDVPEKTDSSASSLPWVILGIVLVVLGVPAAFLLIRQQIRSSRTGYVYELILHGYERASVDAAQWHGHPVSLRELMRAGGLRPLSRQNARQLEQVTLCAGKDGYFTVSISPKCGLQIEGATASNAARQHHEVTLIAQNPNNPFRMTIAFLKRSDDPYDFEDDME